MLRGCYEETAPVEFQLDAARRSVGGSRASCLSLERLRLSYRHIKFDTQRPSANAGEVMITARDSGVVGSSDLLGIL